jgi:hypothetical protein
MNTDGSQSSNADEELVAPAVVLPGGPTTTQGFPPGIATTSISPVLPQPLIRDTGAAPQGLASQLEQRLAEDGRFSGLLPHLMVIADDDTGHVILSGTAPNADLLPFLLSTLRAAPGVRTVEDQTG